MDKKFERNIIWTLAIILILIGVLGCVAVPTTNLNPKKVTITDTIGNMGAIGKALGCMFGSNDPICEKKNVDEDIDEEWNEQE